MSLVLWVCVSEWDSAENVLWNDLKSLDSTCGSIARSERATAYCELLFFHFFRIINSQKGQATTLHL